MKQRRKSQNGYTAAEMVVVLAVIGLFTLAAIPNFVQMYRQNQLRVGARAFASDARWVRMRAISTQRAAKITFDTGSGVYSIEELSPTTGEWIKSRPRGQELRETKLPAGVEVASHTFVDIDDFPTSTKVPDDDDELPDLVYLPDGSPWQLTDAVESIVITTEYDTPKPNFTIVVRPAGNIKTTN